MIVRFSRLKINMRYILVSCLDQIIVIHGDLNNPARAYNETENKRKAPAALPSMYITSTISRGDDLSLAKITLQTGPSYLNYGQKTFHS